MPRRNIVLPTFAGGLNVDAFQEQVAPNELILATNVDFIERGVPAKRHGTDFVNSTSLNGRVIQLFEWPRDDGSIVNLAIVDSNSDSEWNWLVKINDDGSITTIYNKISKKGKRVNFFFLQDMLYLVTGTNYLRWNGTDNIEEVPAQTTDQEGNEIEDCDLTPIKSCTLAIRHPKSFRIFFAGDGTNRLYYSESNDPTYVKELSFVVPTTGDGPVKGLAVYIDALMVFFQRSIWIWRGLDPAEDAIWEKLPVAEGSESPFALESATNQFEYIGSSGHWAMAPSILGATSVVNPDSNLLVNLAENKVQSIIRSITNRELVCAAYDVKRRKNYIAYCDDPDLGYNNKILVRDMDLGCYTIFDGLVVYDLLYKSNGEVWIGSENYVMRFSDNYRDACPDGTYKEIVYDIQTPTMNLGDSFRKKWVHNMTLNLMNPGYDDYELRIRIYADDVLVYDKILIPDTEEKFIEWMLDDLKDVIGKRISIRITNEQVDTETAIYGIELDTELIPNRYGGVI